MLLTPRPAVLKVASIEVEKSKGFILNSCQRKCLLWRNCSLDALAKAYLTCLTHKIRPKCYSANVSIALAVLKKLFQCTKRLLGWVCKVLFAAPYNNEKHREKRTCFMTEAYIYDAIRTPRGRGRKEGSLHTVKPVDLVVGLIDEVRERFPDMDTNRIDDVLLGVVTPIGDQGECIAKTAALAAGLPHTVAGYQLNRFCASGLEAVNTGAQKVASGWDSLILAGGVESMSRVRMGHDGGAWAMDPMTNYQTDFVPQGIGADLIATIEGFSREDVDAFAVQSQERAANAWANGYFDKSVVPVKD